MCKECRRFYCNHAKKLICCDCGKELDQEDAAIMLGSLWLKAQHWRTMYEMVRDYATA